MFFTFFPFAYCERHKKVRPESQHGYWRRKRMLHEFFIICSLSMGREDVCDMNVETLLYESVVKTHKQSVISNRAREGCNSHDFFSVWAYHFRNYECMFKCPPANISGHNMEIYAYLKNYSKRIFLEAKEKSGNQQTSGAQSYDIIKRS